VCWLLLKAELGETHREALLVKNKPTRVNQSIFWREVHSMSVVSDDAHGQPRLSSLFAYSCELAQGSYCRKRLKFDSPEAPIERMSDSLNPDPDKRGWPALLSINGNLL
jgi:hypothetical protein